MKKIKIFLMMLLAVLSFTACDDDDDSKQSIISEYSMNDQQVAAQKAKSGKDKAVLLVAFGSTWTNAFAAFDDTKKAYEDASQMQTFTSASLLTSASTVPVLENMASHATIMSHAICSTPSVLQSTRLFTCRASRLSLERSSQMLLLP